MMQACMHGAMQPCSAICMQCAGARDNQLTPSFPDRSKTPQSTQPFNHHIARYRQSTRASTCASRSSRQRPWLVG